MESNSVTKYELPVLEVNEELYELYALWRSLPIPILSQMTPEQIKQQLGFDDEMALELVDIHTQQDFAAKYGIHMNTLTQWNKKLRERDPLFEAKGWARHLAKNMVMAMYNHGIRKGNPNTMKLFFQIVSDWEESSKIKVTPGDIEFNVTLMRPKVDTPKKPEPIKEAVAVEKVETAKDINVPTTTENASTEKTS